MNLKSEKYEVKIIGYKDDVRTVFSAHPVLGVFLLMSEVGEKGFSVAIKLQSSGYKLPPIIAGGPEWTRSAVLKAVKYGARDILVTPASDDEIRDKATQHISIPA
jgi:DNA-binding response OmpR family regulator